ncbi:MAG: NADH:flavin oxidoreductase [Bacteroidales bacterium]|jgi:2,4-dienoyl-CoA reductase-like NADH-dependent reductase (Old Yellow Enzyme family)|nr:NADH:flavin oxidoreductase [Bacteroidales bacterium]
MSESKIFTPCQIGPITLRNRTIRSAAFENMAHGNRPTKELFDYHTAVARGGVGMTTVAYASVCQSGLSFDGQLWLREEIIPELKKLTDAIHAEGAKASIQIGHCGNMTHRATCGCKPLSPSGRFNLYSPTFTRKMTIKDIDEIVDAFGKAVDMCRRAGFDCIEVHAGHGYLISQFISPYTNHRKDEYGGSLENRMRFMRRVITRVMEEAKDDMAIVVKTNMYDGFRSGMQVDECITVAKELEKLGVHALVLTAGFVSKAPMDVMRGAMPLKTLAYYMDMKKFWWLKLGLHIGGRMVIPTVPYKDAYFYDTAMKFRKELKMPLIYVGGMVDKADMEMVLDSDFVAFQMARALVQDTDFVNKLQSGEVTRSACKHSNYCIGRMYTLDMRCHQCMQKDEIPARLQRELEKAEKAVEKSNKR